MPPPTITPLPDAGLTMVFGLLELLEDRGGREDGYKIARDLNFKFGDLLKVMKAAEILGFVSTPAGDVVLEPLGKQFLDAKINERKLIVREQLKKHGLFSYFIRLLRGQEDKVAPQGSRARTSRDAPAQRKARAPVFHDGGLGALCRAVRL